MRLVAAIVIWAGAVAGGVALSSSVAHTVHNEQAKAAKTTSVSIPTPGPAFDPASIKPADPKSLFIGSNFAHVLALVRDHVGPKADVETIEIFPGQLEMTVRSPDAEVSVVARVNGEYESSSDPNVSGSTQVFSLSQVGENVPASLARRIAAHAHIAISGLNFIQVRIDQLHHEFHWYVYPKRPNVYFQADSARGPIQVFEHGLPRRVIRG